MIYAAYNLELGSEDAYNRVLDGEHRDTVKQAFNAMIQASTALTSKPENIDTDPLGMGETSDRLFLTLTSPYSIYFLLD